MRRELILRRTAAGQHFAAVQHDDATSRV